MTDFQNTNPAGGRGSADQIRDAQRSANPTPADELTQRQVEEIASAGLDDPLKYAIDLLHATGERLQRFAGRWPTGHPRRHEFLLAGYACIYGSDRADDWLIGMYEEKDDLENRANNAEAESADADDRVEEAMQVVDAAEGECWLALHKAKAMCDELDDVRAQLEDAEGRYTTENQILRRELAEVTEENAWLRRALAEAEATETVPA